MINGPYTLFTRIPIYADEEGNLFADELWRKDLELHFVYIDDFRLCCPLLSIAKAPKGVTPVDGIDVSKVVALHKDGGWISVAKNLIPNFRKVATALRKTRVAHSGGAGWAFPLSFYILALSPFIHFRWIMVIESSFWMKPTAHRPTIRQWVEHHLHFFLLGAALRRADARIFTQKGYQRLFNIGDERSLINPAIWVDEEFIISDEDQKRRILALGDNEIRFLFPARLIVDKGPDVVLRAIEILDGMHADGELKILIDIIGEGPMLGECRKFAEEHAGPVKVNFLDTVPYGDAFFGLMRGYHAVVIANRQEEQPRVVFDAFSQGLPVISSDTSGVRDVAAEDTNALFFPVNDAGGLARQMQSFAMDQRLRVVLMDGALTSARGRSHSNMHHVRAQFLEKVLGDGD